MKCDKCGYSDNGSGDWAHACGPVALQRAPVMNERIEKLAEQALNEYSATYHNEAKIPEAYLKKFAELIVRECANVAADHDALDIYEEIREHFGVEE